MCDQIVYGQENLADNNFRLNYLLIHPQLHCL